MILHCHGRPLDCQSGHEVFLSPPPELCMQVSSRRQSISLVIYIYISSVVCAAQTSTCPFRRVMAPKKTAQQGAVPGTPGAAGGPSTAIPTVPGTPRGLLTFQEAFSLACQASERVAQLAAESAQAAGTTAGAVQLMQGLVPGPAKVPSPWTPKAAARTPAPGIAAPGTPMCAWPQTPKKLAKSSALPVEPEQQVHRTPEPKKRAPLQLGNLKVNAKGKVKGKAKGKAKRHKAKRHKAKAQAKKSPAKRKSVADSGVLTRVRRLSAAAVPKCISKKDSRACVLQWAYAHMHMYSVYIL